MQSFDSSLRSVDQHIEGVAQHLRRVRRSTTRCRASKPTVSGGSSLMKGGGYLKSIGSGRLGSYGHTFVEARDKSPVNLNRDGSPTMGMANHRAENRGQLSSLRREGETHRHLQKFVPVDRKSVLTTTCEARRRRMSQMNIARPRSMPLSSETDTLIGTSQAAQTNLPAALISTSTSNSLASSQRSSPNSSLTTVTDASFSSFEYSPMGEIATRQLQWQRAAYGLLASHYERLSQIIDDNKLDAFNTAKKVQRIAVKKRSDMRLLMPGLNKASVGVASQELLGGRCGGNNDAYHRSYERNNEERCRSTSVSKSIGTDHMMLQEKKRIGRGTRSQGEMREGKYGTNVVKETLNKLSDMLCYDETSARSVLEGEEDKGFTTLMRWASRSVTNAAALSAARLQCERRKLLHLQLVADFSRAEGGARIVIENEEHEGITTLIRRAAKSAAAAAALSAARVQREREMFHRRELLDEIMCEEAAARSFLETEEDEGVTAMMRWAGKSAAAAAALSAARLQCERRKLLHLQLVADFSRAEGGARIVIENEEHEGITTLIRRAAKSAAAAAALSAARVQREREMFHRRELLDEIMCEEAAARSFLETEEDEGVTAMMRWAGKSAAAAAALSAARLRFKQFVREINWEEAAARGVIEGEEEAATTVLLNGIKKLPSSVTPTPPVNSYVRMASPADKDAIALYGSNNVGWTDSAIDPGKYELCLTPSGVYNDVLDMGQGASDNDTSVLHRSDVCVAQPTTCEELKGSVSRRTGSDTTRNEFLPVASNSSPSDVEGKGDNVGSLASFRGPYSAEPSDSHLRQSMTSPALFQNEVKERGFVERTEERAGREMGRTGMDGDNNALHCCPAPQHRLLHYQESTGSVSINVVAERCAGVANSSNTVQQCPSLSLSEATSCEVTPTRAFALDGRGQGVNEDPVPTNDYDSCMERKLSTPECVLEGGTYKKPLAWCVSMTNGASGIPPHLRKRPRSRMLMHKGSIRGYNDNIVDDRGCRAETLKGALGRTQARQMSPQTCKTASRITYERFSGVRAHEPRRRNHCLCLRSPQESNHDDGARDPLGYARLYELRLLVDRLDGCLPNGAANDPLHRKATVAFLESAGWRYQKMYVCKYICSDFTHEGRGHRSRRCADHICKEVDRVRGMWSTSDR